MVKKSLLDQPENTISIIDDEEIIETKNENILYQRQLLLLEDDDSDEDIFKGINRHE